MTVTYQTVYRMYSAGTNHCQKRRAKQGNVHLRQYSPILDIQRHQVHYCSDSTQQLLVSYSTPVRLERSYNWQQMLC